MKLLNTCLFTLSLFASFYLQANAGSPDTRKPDYNTDTLERMTSKWFDDGVCFSTTNLPELLPYLEAHYRFTKEGIEKHERRGRRLTKEDLEAWQNLEKEIHEKMTTQQITLSWWLYVNLAFSLFLTPESERVPYFNSRKDDRVEKLFESKAWYSYDTYLEWVSQPNLPGYTDVHYLIFGHFLHSRLGREFKKPLPFPIIDGNLSLTKMNESFGKHFFISALFKILS